METSEATRVVAKSEALSKTAFSLIPGGVMSAFYPWWCQRDQPVIARTPPVIAKGRGATLTDVDGNEYLDYIGAHGAMILGHSDERVVVAISKAASKGCMFGAPSDMGVRLAELIAGRFASVEMIRLVNTPADALMDAVSLAREFTGRDVLITFDGHSYGNAGYGLTARAEQRMKEPARYMLPYNDIEAAEKLFREHGVAIAAVVVEPVSVSSGLIPPVGGFLQALRTLCDAHGALLVFDETVSGFRAGPGATTTMDKVTPDLTLLGPAIGGGLPLGAYGGRKEIMKQINSGHDALRLSPAAGNLLAMAAGIATLQAIGEPGFYDALDAKSARLDEGLRAAAAAAGVPSYHTRAVGILGMFFCDKPVTNAASARGCDAALFTRYHEAMLDRGVLLSPFPLSCIFPSFAHTDEDIDRTIEAAHEALRIAVQQVDE